MTLPVIPAPPSVILAPPVRHSRTPVRHSRESGNPEDRAQHPILRMTCILQQAESAGQLRLVSANPHDKPHIDYRYLRSERDRRRLREAVRLCREILAQPAFAAIVGASRLAIRVGTGRR